MSIGIRGRHGKQIVIDNDILELRQLVKVGASSRAVSLPKLWLELMEREGELKGVGVLEDGDKLIIRPYYGEEGQLDSEEAEG